VTGINEVERARLDNAITRLENQLLCKGESLGTVASALVRALHESSSVIQQLKKRDLVKAYGQHEIPSLPGLSTQTDVSVQQPMEGFGAFR
jgi:hypothetical protein